MKTHSDFFKKFQIDLIKVLKTKGYAELATEFENLPQSPAGLYNLLCGNRINLLKYILKETDIENDLDKFLNELLQDQSKQYKYR